LPGEEKIPNAQWFLENTFSGDPEKLYAIWQYVNGTAINNYNRQQSGRVYYIFNYKPFKLEKDAILKN
jgi:hypothetical protein